MFASKKLLSNYVEHYLNTVNKIQQERGNKNIRKIESISAKYRFLISIINVHCEDTYNGEEYEPEIIDEKDLIRRLNNVLYEEPYSEEELNYIYLNSNIFDEAFLEIAIKRLLFSIYKTKDVEEIINMFEKEKDYLGDKAYGPYINLLRKSDLKKDDIIKYMGEKFEKSFNREFNCGGYALEIFDWVSCNDKDNDDTVTKILANPSVRLLGDSLLQDDEYLVVLDATNYHFIKNKDGKFLEKMRTTSY